MDRKGAMVRLIWGNETSERRQGRKAQWEQRAAAAIGSALLLALQLIACATTPAPLELREARRSYDVAAADPTIATHAPVELFEAAKLVERAEAAQAEEAEPDEVSHLASLGIKQVEIAEAAARSAAAEREAERLRDLRDRVRYEARVRQAEEAQREADEARAQLNALVTASRPGPAQGQGAPTRYNLEDLIAYHVLLGQVDRGRAPSAAPSELEQRLRELELARAADRGARLRDQAAEQTARLRAEETERQRAEEAARREVEAAARTAAELKSTTDAARERLRSLEEAIAVAEERAIDLAIAARTVRGAPAEPGPSRATRRQDVDLLDSQQEVDRLLEELRAERAESQRRIRELKLATAASEERVRALRADREATLRRLRELELGDRAPARNPSGPSDSVASAPRDLDAYDVPERGEVDADEDVAANAPEERSAWRRTIDWLRSSERTQ